MPNIVINYLYLSVIFYHASAFNLSPKPNLVLQEPIQQTYMPKVQSSYFGYSMNLMTNSIIIGAPRAQSSLPAQRLINETGMIYKCFLDTLNCEPFVFDEFGNTNDETNEYIYNSEKKDYQWLGAVMDGGSLDTDRFVVCSPRTMATTTDHYLMHGLCYWTSNMTYTKPTNVQKIAPLKLRDKQQTVVFGNRYYYYMYGEQGISVHITENNEEILIGAPGVYTWKGTVIRYKTKIKDDFGGLSRRDQQGLSTNKRDILEYVSEVPNPALWNQPDDSYFGYAVSSGYFAGPAPSKILYVASAPQANFQEGEVYIFDIIDHYTTDKSIKIYYTFSSHQLGEYFGYALLSDDFDSDGFTDIAIAAPFYKKGSSFENGAVYIYKNQGIIANNKWAPNFELQSVLISEYEDNGRFGTTMSKIGDIDQDGYNDIAIGAPYEGNGAVYIYRGGPNGLSNKPSQKLEAPFNTNAELFVSHMFGHALSKGVDVDSNNYLDLAIGAPNVEAVYIYKAYPVVYVIANIIPESKEIKPTDSKFNFKACWSLKSKHAIAEESRFYMLIKVDPKLGRATFSNSKINQVEHNVTAGQSEKCLDYEVFVKFSNENIFKPIDIEMHHNVLDTVPDSEEFCTTCVAVNPIDPKVTLNQVVFITGCKSAKCESDLRLTSSLIDLTIPYILGSTKTISVEYKIENIAEPAYLTQIKITINDYVTFKNIPYGCTLENDNLLCSILNGSPLFQDKLATLKVTFDTTKLDGNELVIKAEVFSSGDELNRDDNIVVDKIPLAEFSDVEITGQSSKVILSLEDGLRDENITHVFEIRNNGPSIIKDLDVVLSIPMSYLDPWTLGRIILIDFENVVVKGQYNNQNLEIEWSQNNTILFQNSIESSSTPKILDNFNGLNYDPSQIGLDFDLNAGSIHESNAQEEYITTRKKRNANMADKVTYRNYNRYTRSIQEYHDISKRSVSNWDDIILSNLPVNRTTLFDCYNPEASSCVQAKFTVNNFKPGNLPIFINLNFTVDLNKIDGIVTDNKDIFVIKTSAEIIKKDDEEGNSIKVLQAQPYTIISKYRAIATPIWIYIVSTIVGLLTLVLITYGLYRCGFFNRAIKEEQEKLTRQSQALAAQTGQETDDNE